jgi:hypothetical protein
MAGASGRFGLPFRPAAIFAALSASACAHVPANNGSACLAGTYDGGQTEIAAGLALGSDGRFSFGMSYGALDERAEGRWEGDGKSVYLTSDPVEPPAFVLLGEQPSDQLRIELDLPAGLSRQYFDARLEFAGGRTSLHQFGEAGLSIDPGEGGQPVAVTVLLPLFGQESERFALTASPTSELHLRFDPNDLGKVAFNRTSLARENGELLLDRHGRTLRFQPVMGGCSGAQDP